MSKMNNYLITYYDVDPVTFKRIKTEKTIVAYDMEHARKIIDKHPSLIKRIKKV